MSIEKVDCGSVLEGYGNSCFFLSLLEGLRRLELYNAWTFDELINLSKFWTSEQKGKMVDTSIHSDSIQILALKLNVRIVIYTESSNNKVNKDSIMVYGLNKSNTIRIVKVFQSPHYTYMIFKDSNENALFEQKEASAYVARMELKQSEHKVQEVEKLEKVAKEHSKIIDKEMEDHYREIEALKLEKQITNVVIEVSKLQQDLNGWLESLTCIGRNPSVEMRLKILFGIYKDYHDILDVLQSELSKY